MPEGDTVRRTCSRLHEALAGRRLLAVELRWPGLSTTNLAGATVVEVASHGKHILIRLHTGLTLHSHLKMEGQWRIERTRAGGPASRHDDVRAVLVTEAWTALGLRLGRLDLVRTAEEQSVVGHLGPDILEADFDAGVAVANLARAGGAIGAALLDQRNLAGIGTIWASESLFIEHLNPWREDLSYDELHRLVERARRLMLAPPTQRVDPRAPARRGRPCQRCGGMIRVARIGPPTRERAMFYCPACQGGLAPGDHGGPLAPRGARRR